MPRNVELERLDAALAARDTIILEALAERLEAHRRVQAQLRAIDARTSEVLARREVAERDRFRDHFRDLPLEAADELAAFVGDWCDRWS